MPPELSPVDTAKFVAARHALDHVESGMRLGLGTGSTAAFLVRLLGEALRAGRLRDIVGVPTSEATAALAVSVGVPLTTLDAVRWLDLTIDGADEFDARLNLVKGGGGALLREKIVATASDQMIVIADAAKEVASLGAFPLSVEVIPFGWQTTQALIEETLAGLDVMGSAVALRRKGETPVRTDEGNFLLDLALRRIGNPRQVSLVLNQIPGVVENGLFIDICDRVIVGHPDGRVESRDAETGTVAQSRVALDEAANLFRELPD